MWSWQITESVIKEEEEDKQAHLQHSAFALFFLFFFTATFTYVITPVSPSRSLVVYAAAAVY